MIQSALNRIARVRKYVIWFYIHIYYIGTDDDIRYSVRFVWTIISKIHLRPNILQYNIFSSKAYTWVAIFLKVIIKMFDTLGNFLNILILTLMLIITNTQKTSNILF